MNMLFYAMQWPSNTAPATLIGALIGAIVSIMAIFLNNLGQGKSYKFIVRESNRDNRKNSYQQRLWSLSSLLNRTQNQLNNYNEEEKKQIISELQNIEFNIEVDLFSGQAVNDIIFELSSQIKHILDKASSIPADSEAINRKNLNLQLECIKKKFKTELLPRMKKDMGINKDF